MNTFIVAGIVVIAVVSIYMAGLFGVSCVTHTEGTPQSSACSEITSIPTYTPPDTSQSGGFLTGVVNAIKSIITFVGDTIAWFFNVVTAGVGIPTPLMAIITVVGIAVIIYIIVRLFSLGG